MSKQRDDRLATVISELAAEYINYEANKNVLITVTRAEVLNRGKLVIVYFTALPSHEEKKSLEFLERKQSDFRKFLIEKKPVAFPPSIRFAIDYGEKNRQRIDELSQNI